MSQHQDTNQPHIAPIKTYVAGFGISLLLTIAAFVVVEFKIVGGYYLMASLLALAVLQTAAQLWYFLHIGAQDKPNWNLIFMANTIGIILLVVIASIWIMNSLHYRMMSPTDMTEYMLEQQNKGF